MILFPWYDLQSPIIITKLYPLYNNTLQLKLTTTWNTYQDSRTENGVIANGNIK